MMDNNSDLSKNSDSYPHSSELKQIFGFSNWYILEDCINLCVKNLKEDNDWMRLQNDGTNSHPWKFWLCPSKQSQYLSKPLQKFHQSCNCIQWLIRKCNSNVWWYSNLFNVSVRYGYIQYSNIPIFSHKSKSNTIPISIPMWWHNYFLWS